VFEWAVTSSAALTYSTEVEAARESHRPLVALETSVISQGLPRPRNLEAAIAAEEAIRECGATPATLAVIGGRVHVGLETRELEMMACQDGIDKAGVRDLGRAIATGSTIATTVGSSLMIAHRAGISVMATGGIGGVHRESAETGDISNDLFVLANTPVLTVCAGIKSVLDLPRTVEMLETLGVALVGFRTNTLPDFYGSDSGITIPALDDEAAAARMLLAQRSLGISAGIVVANPPPPEHALERDELDGLVEEALSSAHGENIRGKAVTPFLLAHMARASEGRTVDLNVELLLSNARLAARIALALTSA